MSADKRVTEDLIETLRDGQEGFANAAEKLADSDRSELAPKMRGYSQQRAGFADELDALAAQYGDDADDDGSVAAKVHRVWMSLKDSMSGSGSGGVLDAAEQGEDHALSEYEKALSKDISEGLRTVVQRQFSEVKRTHDEVRALRDAA